METPENASVAPQPKPNEKPKQPGRRRVPARSFLIYSTISMALWLAFVLTWLSHQYRQLGFVASTAPSYFPLLFCVFFAKHLAFDYLWIFKSRTKPLGRDVANTVLAIMLVFAPTYASCVLLVARTSHDADKAFTNNEYAKASRLYGRLNELLSPAYRGFDVRQGECLVELGEFQKAVDIYSQALMEHPALELYTARAKALERLHEETRSKGDRFAAINMEEKLGAGPSAQILFDNRQFEEALKAYNELVAKDPLNPKNYVTRGKCYYQLSKDREAIADFTRAIALNSQFGQAFYERSQAYKQLGQTELAQRDLAQAKELGYARFMP